MRAAVGRGVFPVSCHPRALRLETVPAWRGPGIRWASDGVSGMYEFVEGGADGLGAHSGGIADLAAGERLASLGEDGADALSGAGVRRCRRGGFRSGELQGRPLGRMTSARR